MRMKFQTFCGQTATCITVFLALCAGASAQTGHSGMQARLATGTATELFLELDGFEPLAGTPAAACGHLSGKNIPPSGA